MSRKRPAFGFPLLLVMGTLFLIACSGNDATPTPRHATPTADPIANPGQTGAAAPSATTAPYRPTDTVPAEAEGPDNQAPVLVEVAVWGQTRDDGVTFSGPNGIAIDSSDNVYVTEFRGDRVQKFTPDGELLARWGSEGIEEGQFQSPTGIAIDQASQVYVSESGNSRVQVFTADGEWLSSWGSRGSGPGEFLSAMVVTIDEAGLVYVTDWGNNRVQVFNADGEFIRTWGGQTGEEGQVTRTKDGQLFNPTGLAVDGDGNIFVVDRGNSRIQRFTPSGEFLDKIEDAGTGPSRFGVPTSITLDPAGNLYISYFRSNRVQQFSAGGEFLRFVGRDTLAGPHGTAFDSTGAFYVTDTGNNVVRKFRVADSP